MSLHVTKKQLKCLNLKIPSRNKFNAKRCQEDGIKFDSMAERDFYLEAKVDPETVHIDCHVPVTLPAGVRYRIDFVVWKKTFCMTHDASDACAPAPFPTEIKGVIMSSFRIVRKLFDSVHPMRPLRVIRRQGKRWVEV